MMKKNYDKLKAKSDKYDELIKKYDIDENDLQPTSIDEIENEHKGKNILPITETENKKEKVNCINNDENCNEDENHKKNNDVNEINVNEIQENLRKEIINESKKNEEISQELEKVQKELIEKNKLIDNYQNQYKDIVDYIENNVLKEIYEKNEYNNLNNINTDTNEDDSIKKLIEDYNNNKSCINEENQRFINKDVINILEKSVKSMIKEQDKLNSSLEEAHKIIDLQHEKIESINEENNNLLEIMNKEKIRKDQDKLEYSLSPGNNDKKHLLIESLAKFNSSKNNDNELSTNENLSSSGIGMNKLNISSTFNNSMISLDSNFKEKINSIINTSNDENDDTKKIKLILNSLYDKYNVLEQSYHIVNQKLEYQKSANQDIKKMIVSAQIGKALDNNEKLDKDDDELIMKKYCDLLEKNNDLNIELEKQQIIIENLQKSLNK